MQLVELQPELTGMLSGREHCEQVIDESLEQQ